jgi:RHS repeat-associated protein
LAVDPDGYLTRIADPTGASTQLTYDAGGLLTQVIDPSGGLDRSTYDALGRLIRDEEPDGGFKTLARTEQARGYTVTVTTAEGLTSSYQIEDLTTGGERHVDTGPDGLQTVEVTGTDGTTTVTDPDGTVTTTVLGPDPRFGMLAPLTRSLTVRAPSGLTSTLAESRTATVIGTSSLLSPTQVDTITVDGRTYTTTYDAATRTITSTSPEGRRTTLTLDDRGRVVAQESPGEDPTRISYDARGYVASVDQGSRHSAFTYDMQGNLASMTDLLSQTVTFAYDAAGRVTQQTLPDGHLVGFTYDANGNLTSLTPPDRPPHTFTYTPTDLVQDDTPPAAGMGTSSTHYTYNLDQQLIQVDRPDGTAIALRYDDAGRLSAITQPGGTTTLTYDPVSGDLVTIIAPDGGTLMFGYDGGLPTDTTWSGTIAGSVHLTYDTDFRLASESVDGANPIAFQYDRDGLLKQAGDLTLTHDPQSGRLTGATLGLVSDTLGYDGGSGEVASYQASAGGTALFAVQYTRDDSGRITDKTETTDGATHTDHYDYDLAGRLTDIKRDGILVSRYAYDANGNRLSETGPTGTVTGTYDDQDRLLTYGTNAYTYTANGELQRKTDTATGQTTTYTYDGPGNLTAVRLPDGRQVEYIIDGQGRGIGKKVDGVLVQGFLYQDGPNPIAELDAAGNVVSRFIYASRANVPDYLIKSGVTYRIITDQLGSPRLVVDVTTGRIVQRLDYDEFGNVVLDTNPGFQPFGFAGGLSDRDTGLIRFGARDYDPETGRWISKDPIGFLGQSTNLYSYVLNDPVNWVDPWGEAHLGPGHIDLSINPKKPHEFLDRLEQYVEQQIQHGGSDAGHQQKLENALKGAKKVLPKKLFRAARRIAKGAATLGVVLTLLDASDALAADRSGSCSSSGNHGHFKRFLAVAGGTLLGEAAAGAVLGSIVPGAGTLVGLVVGLLGGLIGGYAGEALADRF